jgi:hypothetical protein
VMMCVERVQGSQSEHLNVPEECRNSIYSYRDTHIANKQFFDRGKIFWEGGWMP